MSLTGEAFWYLKFFLQAVHLSPQGVNYVLPMFEHEALQLLRGLHLLNVLQRQISPHFTMLIKMLESSTDARTQQKPKTSQILFANSDRFC